MIQQKDTRLVDTTSMHSRGVRRAVPALTWTVILLITQPELSAVLAQSEQLTQRMIPIPHPMTSLLRSPGIQRELGLSLDLAEDVEQAVDTVDQPLWRLRDLAPEKRNDQVFMHLNQLKRRLSEVLTAQQRERLNQIVWQALGLDALLEPEVITRLRLSNDQTNTIGALLNGAYQRVGKARLNTQIRSASTRQTHIQQIQTDTHQQITAVLNSLQQHAFTRLLGQRVNLSQVRGIACKAPDIQADTWINSKPIELSELKGKVTAVHFYAYGCGNCVRSLPYYNDWHKQFNTDTFAIVGIHRPESDGERDIERVKKKAAQAQVEHPIAIDNDSLAWNAWGNHTWPTTYLIDKQGHVRYWWYGELNWQNNGSEQYLRNLIQSLLREPAEG
jgi:peroxiredoxin